MKKHVVVIGAGFGGLSAAAYLAKAGYKVTVLEKTDQPGGRARVLKTKGFTFDMGPSWYMMPDVFDEFFADFGHQTKDFYALEQLNPSYRVFTEHEQFDGAPYPEVKELFAAKDPGSETGVDKLLQQTKHEYDSVRHSVLNTPMTSWREVLRPEVLKLLLSTNSVTSFHHRIKQVTANRDLQKMLEFMAVFMGGSPRNIPAMYSLLSYVDMGLGVWYPQGGFGAVVRAFVAVAKEQGVTMRYNAPVEQIQTAKGRVTGIKVAGQVMACDAVVANADYQHVETKLLQPQSRTFSANYWRQRTISPSGVLLFLGTKKPVPGLLHHNLFFDTDWDTHFNQIFKHSQWSPEPLLYVCAPSKTDTTVAPKGQENIFVLAPMAAGIEPTKKQLQTLTNSIIQRIEHRTGSNIADNLVVCETRTQKYFTETFNAFKGNAFGLSHTLRQSAIFRPPISNKNIENLFYTGQYTNPGTGVPMVVLSGKVSATAVQKRL